MADIIELKHSLERLAEAIQEMARDAKETRAIESEEEPFWQTRVTEFEYTDGGITKVRTEGNYVTSTTWFRASVAMMKRVAEHGTFASALADLERTYQPAGMRQSLERFAGTIVHGCLYSDPNHDFQRDTDTTIEKLLTELSGGPVVYRAKVEVVGIALRPEKVSLEPGISIRQPTKEDLEKRVRPIGFSVHSNANPSAILEIELRSVRGQNQILQAKVEQCVALLRLFDVGSVQWTSYEMSSESLLDSFGHATMGSGDQVSALETSVVKSEDASKLQRFWRTLNVFLPKDVYDVHKQTSHITLAYDRYSDAVLHNGTIERRIANAVMGLEALFLEETQELSYRLGLRISKILSMVGRNPLRVREVIKEAYAIRSTFAHGGHLDYKAKKRLERKYGDVRTLLLSILDYLRASIIIMIVSRASKDELVDLIDDALLDSDRNQQLQNRAADAKA